MALTSGNKPLRKAFLDQKVELYNQVQFIEADPISIPHRFTKRQDIEIAGFFAAILAWGNRKAIKKSCNRLLEGMDFAPHQFVLDFKEDDLRGLKSFVHRTFNATDLFYLLRFLQAHYRKHDSLESAFLTDFRTFRDIRSSLVQFHEYCFSLPGAPERTRKHIATPLRQSACKRINMFLRWMVRQDDASVDFGLWKTIPMSDLICPLDVHSSKTARALDLLQRKQNDWKAAVELTENLKKMNPDDPVRYDFALFGLGAFPDGFPDGFSE